MSLSEKEAALEGLGSLRAWLEPDGAWTQHSPGRNANGEPVPWDDPDAVSWCLSGAIARAIPIPTGWYGPARRALARQVAYETGDTFENGRLSGWNDWSGRTQAEVLALIDRAMVSVKEGGPK